MGRRWCVVKLKDGREVELELFKFDSCPFCVRVMRTIKELGVEEIRMRDTRREPDANAELSRRGGKSQVPCLFIDGEALYESADIDRWLRNSLAG